MLPHATALSPNGPNVSALAAGVWRMHEWGRDRHYRAQWINTCMELGINCFDHADIYGGMTCESLFGEVLRDQPSLRQQMVLVSKCGIRLPGTSIDPGAPPLAHKVYDTSARHIEVSVENSLIRLGTDYLDVLLIHRPDPLMRPDEVASAFNRLRDAGKVRAFGVSNHSASSAKLLADALPFPLVTNQIELSAWHHGPLRDGVVDQCLAWRTRPMAWSPLGSGRVNEPSPIREALANVARELGASVEATALAWLMHHPSRPIPILGTGRLDRLRDQAQAGRLRLSDAQWYQIYEAGLPGGLP